MESDSLEYAEFLPAPPLRPFVEAFYTLRREGQHDVTRSYRILPDGCIDLVLDLSADGRLGRSFLIGAATGPAHVQLAGKVGFLGARFRPGGLTAFARVPAQELTDGRVALDAVWGRDAVSLFVCAGAAPDWGARVRSLEAWLLRHCDRQRPDPDVQRSVELLRRRGGLVAMREIERESGMSLRQLERRFNRHVGLTPKTFARVTRFQALLAVLDQGRPFCWTDVAYAAGYADQAHLIKEFRRLTGFSPTNWPGRHQGAGCPE